MACGSGSGRGIRTTTPIRLRHTRRRSGRPCPIEGARLKGPGRAEPRGASWRYGWVVGTGHGRTSMPDDPNGFARDLFDGLPARYDRLAELLSFGQNGQWRAEMVGHVIPVDGVILDVASGTAGVALQLAARNATEHGQARVVGVDLTEPMLRQGRRRVAAAGMSDRVELVAGRAEQLPFPDAYFDALT